MGEIVGAAICSHHPGLMQNLDFRLLMGAGTDSDLIGGYKRIRAEIDRVGADTVVILDSHWFTTGYHLVDGVAAYKGRYISDEMPWYLFGVPYDYQGDPELADLVEEVAKETGVKAQTMRDPDLPRHYASINLVHHMRLEDKRVMSVGTCQTAKSRHSLEMGEVLGEAIRRSDRKVVLVASGALSHKFNDLDWKQQHPRIFHPSNVSDPKFVESDLEVIELFKQGRHDQIIANFDTYRAQPWEGFGGHYLQMIGALGGAKSTAKGPPRSEYENARGTGNIMIWFEV